MLTKLPTLTTLRLLNLLLFIAVFTMATRLPADTDTWWHLRAGQYIVENLTIPTTDPFSHTRQGAPWVDHGWLAQAGWYLVFAVGGWPGLSLTLAALVTLTFWLVWQVTPGNPYIRAFAVIVGAITAAVIWVARPQMVSFLLAGLMLFLLEKYKRAGKKWIFAMPLILLLWANIHGGYAIAFMLVVAYLLGEAFNRMTGHHHNNEDPVLSWQQMGLLVLVAGVSFLAVAINPHGTVMWSYPFRTVGIGALRDFIQEWQSPDFHQPMTWPFVGMLLLTLSAIGRTTRRIDWTDLALIGMWSIWSLFAGRNIGMYGLLTVPLLARYLDAWVGDYLPSGTSNLQQRRPGLGYLNWALLGLICVAALLKIGWALTPQPRINHFEATLPVAAVAHIQAEQPPGPLFNSYNWGGYLIFELWPDYPVYVDGRTDLYDDQFLRRYIDVIVANEGWRETLTADGINLVLVETSSVLAKFLRTDEAWSVAYQDDFAMLFTRREPLP